MLVYAKREFLDAHTGKYDLAREEYHLSTAQAPFSPVFAIGFIASSI